MANTWPVMKAQVAQGPRSNWEPEVVAYTIASGQTFFDGAILVVSAGAAQEAANGANSNIIGLALHSALAVYNPATTAPANFEQPYETTLFGASQAGTKLQPIDANQVRVAHAVSGQYFELTASGVSASGNIGSTFNIIKDATTGYWTINLGSSATPAMVVVALVQKPYMLPGTSPAVMPGGGLPAFGDTNVRYIAAFLPTVTA